MTAPTIERPPYVVPSVAETRRERAGKWGYTHVSTFSGAGGTALGFEIAGFETVWASEFIPAARDVFAANFPGVYVDPRDIREVRADEIREAAGLGPDEEIDVLDGSPPCASFSMVGSRADGWGKVVKYSETEQRVDDLFDEFVRILDGLRPRVFVAENVAGLVRGKAVGYFRDILRAMRAAGYRVDARLVSAQWLGTPQTRERLFFIGVREDLDAAPIFPDPFPYRYTVEEALADVPEPVEEEERGPSLDGYAIGREAKKLVPGVWSDRYLSLGIARWDRPSPTITQTGGIVGAASVIHPDGDRKFSIPELRRLCGFPDDFALSGTYQQRWERLTRAVPPPVAAEIAATIRDEILTEIDR